MVGEGEGVGWWGVDNNCQFVGIKQILRIIFLTAEHSDMLYA